MLYGFGMLLVASQHEPMVQIWCIGPATLIPLSPVLRRLCTVHPEHPLHPAVIHPGSVSLLCSRHYISVALDGRVLASGVQLPGALPLWDDSHAFRCAPMSATPAFESSIYDIWSGQEQRLSLLRIPDGTPVARVFSQGHRCSLLVSAVRALKPDRLLVASKTELHVVHMHSLKIMDRLETSGASYLRKGGAWGFYQPDPASPVVALHFATERRVPLHDVVTRLPMEDRPDTGVVSGDFLLQCGASGVLVVNLHQGRTVRTVPYPLPTDVFSVQDARLLAAQNRLVLWLTDYSGCKPGASEPVLRLFMLE